jgi:hypothetical protein
MSYPKYDEITGDENTRPVDEKGRIIDIESMSDRELLVEMVKVTRVVTDKAEQFLNDLPNNPMMKMMGKFF